MLPTSRFLRKCYGVNKRFSMIQTFSIQINDFYFRFMLFTEVRSTSVCIGLFLRCITKYVCVCMYVCSVCVLGLKATFVHCVKLWNNVIASYGFNSQRESSLIMGRWISTIQIINAIRFKIKCFMFRVFYLHLRVSVNMSYARNMSLY